MLSIFGNPAPNEGSQEDDGSITLNESIDTELSTVASTVQIHPNPDLHLITVTTEFHVLSTALRLSSPVFKTMLDPNSPFVEGQSLAGGGGGEPAKITLPEDDPDALEIILNIIHHRGNLIPKKLKSSMMYEVAVLGDKYDMVGCLQGWGLLWLGNWLNKKKSVEKLGKKARNILVVAWAFKDEEMIENVTKWLIPNVQHFGDPKGELSLYEGASNVYSMKIDGMPDRILGLCIPISEPHKKKHYFI